MSEYVDSPVELTTRLTSEQVRKIINKSLKTFGGFRYRPDKSANDFRCEITSGEHSGGTVVVQLRDDGMVRNVRMVVVDAFMSSTFGMKQTMGVHKANTAINEVIRKVRKNDPGAAVNAA